MPIAFWKLFQKCAVNLVSLSDTMDTGTPCSLTISRMYNRQNLSKAKVIRTARKCADFVSRSTITHTVSCFCCVRGKWITKSIVTCSHFHSATSNVSLNLLTCEISSNKVPYVSLHPTPIYWRRRSWYIFVPLGCTENREQ